MTNIVVTTTASEVVVGEENTTYIQVTTEGPAGPRGPAGADAPLKTVKVDASTAGTQYVGKALLGTAESAALWRIVKSTFSSAGVLLTSGTATNVTWTGRTGHTYT